MLRITTLSSSIAGTYQLLLVLRKLESALIGCQLDNTKILRSKIAMFEFRLTFSPSMNDADLQRNNFSTRRHSGRLNNAGFKGHNVVHGLAVHTVCDVSHLDNCLIGRPCSLANGAQRYDSDAGDKNRSSTGRNV